MKVAVVGTSLLCICVIGCATIPSRRGTWVGFVAPQMLRPSLPRSVSRNDRYEAVGLRIIMGPEVPEGSGREDNDDGRLWLPSPILVDEEDRVLDASAFKAGEAIEVEGTAYRLGDARAPTGAALTYADRPEKNVRISLPDGPLMTESEVGALISVDRAFDAHGKRIKLRLAARQIFPATGPAD